MSIEKEKIDAVIIANMGTGIENSIKDVAPEKREFFKKLYGMRATYFKGAFRTQLDIFNLARKDLKGDNENWSMWKLPSLGGIILIDYLTKSGLNVEFVNTAIFEEERLKELLSKKPRCVLLSTTFVLSLNTLKKMTELIRRYNNETKIIIGGTFVHNQFSVHGCEKALEKLSKSGGDFFVFSIQGEFYVRQVIQAIKEGGLFEKIPNLGYYDGKMWKFTFYEKREFELDDMNIDFSNKKLSHYFKDGSVLLRTAKSCPFKCSFCTYPSTAGKHVLMDVGDLRKQFDSLKIQGVKNLFFVDDTFNVPPVRFNKLLDLLIEGAYGFQWYSFLRLQYCDEKTIEKMKKSGCKGVFLGIESGDERVLKSMEKMLNSEEIKKRIPLLNKAGIFSLGAFIVGFPGETEDTLKTTKDFIEQSGLTFFFMQEFYYLHNAPIHEQRELWNLSGEGLKWSHETMNSEHAIAHKLRLYREIKNVVPVDPDMTIWQIGYLQSAGMSIEDISEIHRLSAQMMLFDLDEVDHDQEKNILFEKIKNVIGKG